MFFILSKLLYFTISPYTWILVALYFALLSKKELRKKRAKRWSVALILLFSNGFLQKEVLRQWEIFGQPISTVKHHDVAIVLGGMAEYNNDLKEISIRRGGDRIWQAISLYKAGKVDYLLISGDNGYVSSNGLHEAEQMKSVLVKWGIPAEDILTEGRSRNTFENAVETKKILKKKLPIARNFLLVTSGRHMRRAKAIFDHQGLKCTPFSTDLYTGPKRYYQLEDFILPDAGTLSDWHGLIKEMVGYVVYDITGKL